MNIIKADILTNIDFIEHGFFDRIGGVSSGNFESLNVGLNRGDLENNVIENRTKIANHFNISLENLVILNQVHGETVHIIDKNNIDQYKFSSEEKALLNEGDAIITKQKNILIGVNTADCAPILLCDPKEKVIAAIHAGWKGALLGNIIENTIAQMKSMNCHNIFSAIGPCIQRRSFIVKPDLAEKIDKRYLTTFDGNTLFDMQLLILEKLMKLGVKSASKMNINTFSNENFFSHRRQEGKCGVQFSGIILKD